MADCTVSPQPRRRAGTRVCCAGGQQQVFRVTFPGIRNSVRAVIGKQADSLARKFHETHDMAVKDELERLLKEYGELGKPWEFVAR